MSDYAADAAATAADVGMTGDDVVAGDSVADEDAAVWRANHFSRRARRHRIRSSDTWDDGTWCSIDVESGENGCMRQHLLDRWQLSLALRLLAACNSLDVTRNWRRQGL